MRHPSPLSSTFPTAAPNRMEMRRLLEGQRIVVFPQAREAHLTQNTLKMRLPISNHPRNSQKKRTLQCHL
jgi:hypothetical protein